MDLDALEDQDLMAMVRADRTDAMAILFRRHHGPLFGFLFRMTGQAHLSEDLVQEVFLRVMRYAKSYREGASFRAWAYQIARNALADHWAYRPPEVAMEEGHLEHPTDDPGAMAHAQAAQDEAFLLKALDRLPSEKRELLLMSRDPELTYRELAGLCGVSPAAIKVRVHRAMQELREVFFRLQEVRP